MNVARFRFNTIPKINILYSVRRFIESLWTDAKVITITEWFNWLTTFVYGLYIKEPAVFDYNKRLILLSVIQLSGGPCIEKPQQIELNKRAIKCKILAKGKEKIEEWKILTRPLYYEVDMMQSRSECYSNAFSKKQDFLRQRRTEKRPTNLSSFKSILLFQSI